MASEHFNNSYEKVSNDIGKILASFSEELECAKKQISDLENIIKFQKDDLTEQVKQTDTYKKAIIEYKNTMDAFEIEKNEAICERDKLKNEIQRMGNEIQQLEIQLGSLNFNSQFEKYKNQIQNDRKIDKNYDEWYKQLYGKELVIFRKFLCSGGLENRTRTPISNTYYPCKGIAVFWDKDIIRLFRDHAEMNYHNFKLPEKIAHLIGPNCRDLKINEDEYVLSMVYINIVNDDAHLAFVMFDNREYSVCIMENIFGSSEKINNFMTINDSTHEFNKNTLDITRKRLLNFE
jgi:hypothetical protein